ncbi:hypothetical protein Dimus_007628 [Dionaea muscipula]
MKVLLNEVTIDLDVVVRLDLRHRLLLLWSLLASVAWRRLHFLSGIALGVTGLIAKAAASVLEMSNLSSSNEKNDELFYDKLHLDDCEMPPQRFIMDIARGLREAMKLNLFNFDMIWDTRFGNRYLVIDINYFPGGENRRRDDEEMNDEAENAENIDGEHTEKQAEENTDSGSGDKFFYAMDDVEDPADVTAPISDVIAPEFQMCQFSSRSIEGKTRRRVAPLGPASGSMLDFDLLHLQAEFARVLQRNTRFQELYQELKSKTPSSPKL